MSELRLDFFYFFIYLFFLKKCLFNCYYCARRWHTGPTERVSLAAIHQLISWLPVRGGCSVCARGAASLRRRRRRRAGPRAGNNNSYGCSQTYPHLQPRQVHLKPHVCQSRNPSPRPSFLPSPPPPRPPPTTRTRPRSCLNIIAMQLFG